MAPNPFRRTARSNSAPEIQLARLLEQPANSRQGRLRRNHLQTPASSLGIQSFPIQPAAAPFLQGPARIERVVVAANGGGVLLKRQHLPMRVKHSLPRLKRRQLGVEDRAIKIKNHCPKHSPTIVSKTAT